MKSKKKIINLVLLSAFGVTSFLNPLPSLASDFNENAMIKISVNDTQEMANVEKEIYQHNQQTEKLWNLATLRESTLEDINNFPITMKTLAAYKKAYVTVDPWFAGYSYEYVASYQVYGTKIIDVKPLTVRPNYSNVTTNLEGYNQKFLDQQRVVAYKTDVRVSVKNLETGKIKYYTLHDYIEFNYEYKGRIPKDK